MSERVPLLLRRGAVVAAALVALIAPFYVASFWLQAGLFVMAGIIAAAGLGLLVGSAGQLSLGHAFFVGIGAYLYTILAGGSSGSWGAHLPTALAAVLAILLSGAVGGIVSPIAARARGVYLAVATLGLVFVGQYLLESLPSVTGGATGLPVPPLNLFGFHFGDTAPDLVVADIPLGRLERLWYLGLVVCVAACLASSRLRGGRFGRALRMMKNDAVAASAVGIRVRRLRAWAFVIAAVYAGLGGVLFALASSVVVPDTFDTNASISYLAMVFIGGAASTGGAASGAVFVTALPLVLGRYGAHIPFLGSGDTGQVTPAQLANYVYGLVLVAVILLSPRGISGFLRTARAR